MVEISHDTGLSVASLNDYEQKHCLVQSGIYGVWGWKEDSTYLARYSPSLRMKGTSFIKYPDAVSNSIELLFLQWKQGCLGGDTIDVDLTSNSQKLRNGHTGLDYEIDFQDMEQTNKKTGFQRAVRRKELFKDLSCKELKRLPSLPHRSPRSFTFLPTFAGQLIQVKRTVSNKQWYYGKVIYGPNESTGYSSEGWFPAVFCKKADSSVLVKAASSTKNHLMPPETWESERSGCVAISSRSREYKGVETFFAASMNRNCTIISVERIQAVDQWKLYAVKADSFRARYKANAASLVNNTYDKVEMKWLFHGTDCKTVPKIVSQGFNRAFAGRNATYYGKGSYFARDAGYSLSYTTPDKYGIRSMFLCRVAVGDWCQGTQDQVTPDTKPGTNNELFDSTVDDVGDPSIFVVYHDTQAYPEYLVTFTL